MSIKNKLLAVLEVYLEQEVTVDTPILNSSATENVETIMLIEDELGVEISDEDAQNLVTVQDVVTYLDSKTDKNDPPEEEKMEEEKEVTESGTESATEPTSEE